MAININCLVQSCCVSDEVYYTVRRNPTSSFLCFYPTLRENYVFISHSLTNQEQMSSVSSRTLYCLKVLEGAVDVITTKGSEGCQKSGARGQICDCFITQDPYRGTFTLAAVPTLYKFCSYKVSHSSQSISPYSLPHRHRFIPA